MGYLSLTDADRAEMLAAIGVSSIDELFEQIPPGVRFDRELDVPPALGEAELVRHLEELAAKNVHTGSELSFVGAGIYDHYVPSVADVVFSRGEFLTAYTPYQPEMSQGTLQAIFEYQTVICELTGMDVSNASGYDGCTVAADACFVARHVTDRRKVVLAETLNPQVRQVVKTYAPGFGFDVVEVAHRGGVIDPDELAELSADAGAVFFQQPNLPRMPRGRAGPGRSGERGRRAGRRPRRPHVARRARGAGRIRMRDRARRGAVGGELAVLRRPALRLPGGAWRLRASHAGTHRRRDRGRGRPPSVRAHAPDARAAHPAREGDLEHHDEPDAARARRARDAVVARAERGCKRSARRASRSRSTRASECRSHRRSTRGRSRRSRSGLRCRLARSSVARASTGVNPGYALGRDYEGMDDVLLVAVTEKKTVDDVDRLADVLGEVCA